MEEYTTPTSVGIQKVKLNLYIFKQILYYLAIVDNSKERLLELSLLSKSFFKIFQNIIKSYDYNKNKFILSLSQLIRIKSTISNNNSNNDNSYQYKLIQYKEIERIKVPEISKEYNKLLNNGSFPKVHLEIHSFLKSNCTQLKKVVLLNLIRYYQLINYDFTFGSFFKVKKLNVIWTDFDTPISINEILNVRMTDYGNFSFSFNFLLKYNPSKLIIGTLNRLYYGHLHLNHLENILNCKSIKSIKFKNHSIPREFLRLILNANHELTQ